MSPPQVDTRVYDEAYLSYVEEVNPRRTQFIGKRAISRWKIVNCFEKLHFMGVSMTKNG